MNNSVLDNIINFLSSNNEDLSIPMCPISKIDVIMKSLGFIDNKDYETNGWQCDFWKTYVKEDLEIEFSGSLYYGEFKLRKLWH